MSCAVLAQRRARSIRRGLVQTDRAGNQLQIGPGAVRYVLDPATGAEERVVESACDIVHGRARYAAAEHAHPVRGVVGTEVGIQQRGQRVAILEPGEGFGETGIGLEVGPFDEIAEQFPEMLVLGHDDDPTVCGAKELRRDRVGVPGSRHPLGDESFVQIPGAGVTELVHRDVVERHIDVPSLAGVARAENARQERRRDRRAGHVVDHGQAEACRRAVRLAGQ